jgi:hypothetical protein
MVLGVLAALAALWELYPLSMTVGYKMHLLPATGAEAKYVPLMQATQWWQVAIWIAVTVLFALTAWRLLRGTRALMVYATAFVLQVLGWWMFHSMPVYRQTFTPAELQMDYYVLGVMLLIGLLIWWVERRPTSAETAAA